MYKYSCRKCPIRNRCIDQSSNADSIKIMIRRAFEARTDTLATWGRLQKNCLLVQAEEDKKPGTSPLSARLQQAREAKDTAELEEANTSYKTAASRIRPLGSNDRQNTGTGEHNRSPEYLQPVAPKEEQAVKPLKRLFGGRAQEATPELCWFTIQQSKRHITLPTDGGIVLGRFDPNVGIPPDIDLTFEDRNSHLISRRHATIFAANGKHTIEDLGSKSGVFLNGSQINYRPSRVLEPGDLIKLGGITLEYNRIPNEVLQKAKTDQVRHILYITANGRRMQLNPPKNAVIGRSDPSIKFVPDIDLSRDGDVARLVSRRHALIQWRFGQSYLEDLGSGFGTRLRGDLLLLGKAVPLTPGDHIWLAGCVMAYDIEF